MLSARRAAELLPIGDQEARRWLRERGLVRYLEGRPVVRWRDVLDALAEPELPPRSPTLPLARTKLNPL